jgi:cellulose synthase (UDP-forming)
VRPDAVASVADRDILVIGTMQRMQAVNTLLAGGPLTFSSNRMSLNVSSSFDSVRRLFSDQGDAERQRVAASLQAVAGDGTAAMVGLESPLARHRSVVAILAASPQALEGVITTLRDNEQSPLIQGDLALLSGGHVTSYRVGPYYTVGTLPFWLYPSYLLRDQPFGIVLLMLVGCIFAGLALFWAMRRRADVRMLQTTQPRSSTR